MGSEVSFRQNVTNTGTAKLPITNTQKSQSNSARFNCTTVDAGTLDPLYVHLNGIMSRDAGFRIPVGGIYFLFTKTVKNGSVFHPASYSIWTEFISEGYSGQEMKLTYDLHVAPRLRMRGALNLLSLYTFMAGTRPLLTSTFLTPPERGETIYGPSESILL